MDQDYVDLCIGVGIDFCYFEALDFVEGDRGALVKVRWRVDVW